MNARSPVDGGSSIVLVHDHFTQRGGAERVAAFKFYAHPEFTQQTSCGANIGHHRYVRQHDFASGEQ